MTPTQIASLVIVALSALLSIHAEVRIRRHEKWRREQPFKIAEARKREAEERQLHDVPGHEHHSI